ncbi:hypothetical protein G195_011307 [Phytophthora kernoviae 00238/432]|uniref:Uncharacterized protein n=1 Tax=Phytophthora kernoviae 00238/432 TaxID=1284355 RepID=A0A8J4W6A4_9STRA|nr:hypothetical protein G195_011307 [Phytophthora kernoviae 00238/432]
MRDGTLRIVTELLRDENKQLLTDRDALKGENDSLKTRLEKTQRSLRDLEDDVARIYRQKQKETETQCREFEKERLQLLEKLQQVEQTKKSKKLELRDDQGDG